MALNLQGVQEESEDYSSSTNRKRNVGGKIVRNLKRPSIDSHDYPSYTTAKQYREQEKLSPDKRAL